jgi:predicted nuclease with TOPRIM domain
MERDQALTRVEEVRAANAKAQADLDHFREMAVAALEPINAEYKRIMKELVAETEKLTGETQKVQEETQQRLEQLKASSGKLEEHIRSVRREFAERLSTVLGTDADLTPAPVPREDVPLEASAQEASSEQK